MGKKWKPHNYQPESTEGCGTYTESYNAVHYEYDTRPLAKPTGVRKMSEALLRFRDNVKKNNAKVISFVPESVAKKEESESYSETVSSKKKKKMAKNKVDVTDDRSDQLAVENVVASDVENSNPKLKKKKKRKNKETDEKTLDCEAIYTGVTDSDVIKKKKKPKREKHLDEICDVNKGTANTELVESCFIERVVEGEGNEKLNNCELQANDKDEVLSEANCDVECAPKKKRKKNKKDKDCEHPPLADSAGDGCESKAEKKKKKEKKEKGERKEEKGECEEQDIEENIGMEEVAAKSSKSKKRKAVLLESKPGESMAERTSEKKKRKKNKTKETPEENPRLSEDTTCEPPKKKKKKSKSKQQDCEERGEADTCSVEGTLSVKMDATSGQWSDVSLGSGERTTKFLRLMGGLKENGKKIAVNGKVKFNGALNTDQERKLNDALEEQYVQAKQAIILKGKGVGLGFEKPPGEGKKFYIDAQQSKSVKFDD